MSRTSSGFIEFKALVGKTITDIMWLSKGYAIATLGLSDGSFLRMYDPEIGSKEVYIEDVCGNIQDLIGSPIVRAEEYSNEQWTFYIIGTAKGTVTIRWVGPESDYYGERVSLWLDMPGLYN